MTPDDIAKAHTDAIASMTDEQRLAMARELLASRARLEAGRKSEFVDRGQSLDAVFCAEAEARRLGAVPKVDFFLPIDNDFPEVVLP